MDNGSDYYIASFNGGTRAVVLASDRMALRHEREARGAFPIRLRTDGLAALIEVERGAPFPISLTAMRGPMTRDQCAAFMNASPQWQGDGP